MKPSIHLSRGLPQAAEYVTFRNIIGGHPLDMPAVKPHWRIACSALWCGMKRRSCSGWEEWSGMGHCFFTSSISGSGLVTTGAL